MIIGVSNFKGGVCKTTSAIHIAHYLQQRDGNVLLLDGDSRRSALKWSARGPGLPFAVEPIEAAAMAEGYSHKVIDTGQNPEERDFIALARHVDMLILPATPEGMDTDGLGDTIRAAKDVKRRDGMPVQFRVLFARVPPFKAGKIEAMRKKLEAGNVTVLPGFIPRLDAFDKAFLAGITVDQVKDDTADRAWAAYAAAGKELLDGRSR